MKREGWQEEEEGERGGKERVGTNQMSSCGGLVPARDCCVTNHILSRFTVYKLKSVENRGINSVVHTTHKDRTEERFKVMTTWDLISVSVGTETAAVILPGVLGNSLLE